MAVQIDFDRTQLIDFCKRHHFRKLAFFGSVLRGDFKQNSDVDVLYEFEPGHAPGWNIADIEAELSAILGRSVDFVPLKYLNNRIRAQVLAEAEIQYAA